MNKQSDKSKVLDAIEAIAERAECGEDVSAHFTNRSRPCKVRVIFRHFPQAA